MSQHHIWLFCHLEQILTASKAIAVLGITLFFFDLSHSSKSSIFQASHHYRIEKVPFKLRLKK